ncbi:MAG: NAD(P)-dependent oxidoreductase [Pirellulales bacterium]|nr:NAD(P)-dependent oxidoreductase [Pirellulales bacterium]
MNAIITGITGFAGGFLAEHLLAEGDRVLGISRGHRWNPDSSPLAARQVELVSWDSSAHPSPSPVSFETLASFAPEAIYHLAAISIPADCGGDRPLDSALRANVAGTRHVLELAGRLPSRPRVLVVSTSHVYATTTDCRPLTEDALLGPTRAYGMTKLAAEQEAMAAARSGVDVVIARAFQHTGPRQAPRMMLPEWSKQFADPGGRPVKVLRLNAFIDLSDVRDVVQAYRLLVAHGESGGVYNVGSGRQLRSGDVLAELACIADPARRILELDPTPKHDPIADIGRLVAATAWQPRLGWQQTVADTYAFWREKLHDRSGH